MPDAEVRWRAGGRTGPEVAAVPERDEECSGPEAMAVPEPGEGRSGPEAAAIPERDEERSGPEAMAIPEPGERRSGPEAAAGRPAEGAALPPERRERHSRQIRYAPIGERGQLRLAAAAVLVVGAGALGASLAQHMVRAGVGLVRLADRDYVELSNLQRQTLFDEDDARAALPKAAAAAARLRRIDSAVRVEPFVADVTAANIDGLLAGIDAVLDGTDNVRTRLLLNERCRARGIPLLYGGVSGAGGMAAAFLPDGGPCLRCVIGGETGAEGANCETDGVISPAVELIAALQAAEALKWLTGSRTAMRSGWLAVELWPFRVRELGMPLPDPACPVCGGQGGPGEGAGSAEGRLPADAAADAGSSGRSRSGTEDREEPAAAGPLSAASGEEAGRQPPSGVTTASLCGRDSVQVMLERSVPLGAAEAAARAAGWPVTVNPYLLRVELPDGKRFVLFDGGRALVQGTTEPGEAVRVCRGVLERIGG